MKVFKAILFAMVMAVTLGACTNIEPGYEAVVYNKRGGIREIGPSNIKVGMLYYNPITTAVLKYPNRLTRIQWAGEERVSFNGRGARLTADVAFAFRVKPGESYRIMQKYGNVPIGVIQAGYVRDTVIAALGVAASNRELLPLLTTEREEFVVEAQEIVNKRLAPDGFEVQALSITSDIQPPERVAEQINGILEAQNHAEEQRQRVAATLAEADSKRAAAEGERDRVVTLAGGQAEARVLAAEAEAKALEVLNTALENNPRVLELRTIEKWSGVLPQVMGGSDNPLDILITPPSQ